MKNIREAVHDVIEQRILPWIERDGISKLILPEQITPADCARPMKCKHPCTRRHREHDLAIGLTGKATYCIDNKTFIFTPGRIVLLPAGTPRVSAQKTVRFTWDLDPDRPPSMLWLTVHPFGVRVQVSHTMDNIDAMEGSWTYILMSQHFNRLITCLLEEVRSRPPNYARVGRCILLEFMERYLQADAADALTIPIRPESTKVASEQVLDCVQTARQFIHSNYQAPIGLDDIADAANASAHHLSRQFKTATGLPPIQYLLDLRMEAARELLLTDLKVAEVSRLVGVEDPYYFSRLFRRINGASPLQYRRKMAKIAKRPLKSSKSRKSHKAR